MEVELDRIAQLEETVGELLQRVEQLEKRIAALEEHGPFMPRLPACLAGEVPLTPPVRLTSDPTNPIYGERR